VEGCAGVDTHRGDGGAECLADLALEHVQLRIDEEAELEGEWMRSPRMTRILRDCVSMEVERALMRDVVVRLSSSQCLVKVR
jgi:hypothetical protein